MPKAKKLLKKKLVKKPAKKVAKKVLTKKAAKKSGKKILKKKLVKKPAKKITKKKLVKKSGKKVLTKKATKKTGKKILKKKLVKKPAKKVTKKKLVKKLLKKKLVKKPAKKVTKKKLVKKVLKKKLVKKLAKKAAKKTLKKVLKNTLLKKPAKKVLKKITNKLALKLKAQADKNILNKKSKSLLSSLKYREKELQILLNKEKDTKVILKDMEGRSYCLTENCDYPAIIEDYCRIHFFGLFKSIQKKKQILEQNLLLKNYQQLIKNHSTAVWDHLFKDLSTDKSFNLVCKKLAQESAEEWESEDSSSDFD